MTRYHGGKDSLYDILGLYRSSTPKDVEHAYQRLKAAIELEPGNRQRARADADFLGILGYPPMVALLHLDR